MTTRTIAVLVALEVYLNIPHGLYDHLQQEGFPHWVVLLAFAIFVAPALLLAWWLIDRKRT